MADLTTGANAEGYEAFCEDIYNYLKNSWRQADPCTNLAGLTAGMVVNDSNDNRLYLALLISECTCSEILQSCIPLTDDVEHGYGTDFNVSIYYDEAGNDELMIEAANRADTEGVTVSLLETNQRFRIRQNSDVILVSHDGTDANLAWTGTDLNLLPPAGGAVVIDGGANNLRAGLDIINLGTATIGVDMTNSGLAGATDYLTYLDANNYWRADGRLKVGSAFYMQNVSLINEGSTKGALFQNSDQSHPNLKIHASSALNDGMIELVVNSNGAIIIGDDNPILGSLTNCTSNGTATIAKAAAWGFLPAIGDLVHITDATTAADEGFYRVVGVVADTSFTVDRALAGSDADVDVTFYQDIIGFFITDGVNGQRIMNYSHQDKPLQIGGDTLIATANLGSEDVLMGGLLGLTNHADPAGAFTNGTILYAKDSSDGAANSTLAIYTEQAVEVGAMIPSHKLKIWVNGVEYWMSLDAV